MIISYPKTIQNQYLETCWRLEKSL